MIVIKRFEDKSGVMEYAAFEDENKLANLKMTLDFPDVVITELNAEGTLADGLCRAALDYADRHGVSSARFSVPDVKILTLRQLGFVDNDKNSIDNIGQFFASHKNCGK